MNSEHRHRSSPVHVPLRASCPQRNGRNSRECTARTSWCSALRMASRARLELALLFLFICTCVRHVRHPSAGSVTSTGQLGWESELPALSPASAKEDWKMETRLVCLSFRFLSGANTQVGRTVAMIGSALGTQPSISSAWETRLVTAMDMEREQENHILGAVVCSLLLSDLRPLSSFSASRRLVWMAGLGYTDHDHVACSCLPLFFSHPVLRTL